MSFGSSPGVYLRCSLNSTEKPWKGLACSPCRKPLHDELRAQVQPLDLADHFGLQVLFGGGMGASVQSQATGPSARLRTERSRIRPVTPSDYFSYFGITGGGVSRISRSMTSSLRHALRPGPGNWC